MMRQQISFLHTAKLLTLLVGLISMSGCAYINSQLGESCKSRAHVKMILADYLNSRFHSRSPIRMAIIPFSVPANISSYGVERPGAGNLLAQEIHSRFLSSGEVPIVEILNREDWPGKKGEFFTGNFKAIELAREAGYDLALVGMMEESRGLDSVTVHSKIIEVDSGITVWYGTVNAWSRRPEIHDVTSTIRLEKYDPSRLYLEPLLTEAARCTVSSILDTEETVP